MDLTSDNPFWLLKNGLLANYPALDRDLVCEVAVIGAGITGALVARSLVKAGIDTIVLDRRDVGQGSTSATTALLQYEIDTHLVDLIGMAGREGAERAYRLCLGAIEQIESCVAELPDRCGFERRQSLYLASHQQDVEVLKNEHAARRSCGIAVDFLTSDDVAGRFSLTAPAALLSRDAAQMDAYRFTHALFQRTIRNGLRVYDRTEVVNYEHFEGGVQLITDRDFRVTANRIVFATGYESQSLLKQRAVTLKSTYALVTQPMPDLNGWLRECLLWEASRPYVYLRTTQDGRILIGGEDDDFRSPTRRNARISKKSKRLLKRLHDLIPGVAAEIEYAWAGTFAETKDGLPFIGPCGEFPHADFALGFGGNGITFSMIAADILRDSCRGLTHPDAHLFRFGR